MQKNLRKIIFWTGLVFFVAVRFYFHFSVVQVRHAPIEIDDAYQYIIEATQMRDCFWQDCPALEDLRPQFLTQADDLRVSLIQSNRYFRIFVLHHPAYSAAYLAIHALGFTYEQTYHVIVLLGSLFLSISIGIFLRSAWGEAAAGISLFFMSFMAIPDQGLNVIVPGSLATGVAMLIWAHILVRKEKSNYGGILSGMFILLMLHPTGIFYGAIALGIYAVVQQWPIKRNIWIKMFWLALLVGIRFAMVKIVHTPEFEWDEVYFYPGAWGLPEKLNMFNQTWQPAISMMRFWSLEISGYLAATALILLGFLIYKGEKRLTIYTLGLLLIGVYAGTWLYLSPFYPYFLSPRVFVPMAIFLTGGMGYAIAELLFFLAGKVSIPLLDKVSNFIPYLGEKQKSVLIKSGISLLLLVFIYNGYLENRFVNGHHYRLTQEYQIHDRDMRLDTDSIEDALATMETEDSILYMHEIPLFYYLINGADQYGAVYGPALLGTEIESEWITENESIRYLVGVSPIYVAFEQRDGFIPFSTDDQLHINFQTPMATNDLQIHIIADSALTLVVSYGDIVESIILDGSVDKWIDLPSSTASIDRIYIEGVSSDAEYFIGGIRLNEAQKTAWPWGDLDLQLYKDGAIVSDISLDVLTDLPDWHYTGVNDLGGVYVFEVDQEK